MAGAQGFVAAFAPRLSKYGPKVRRHRRQTYRILCLADRVVCIGHGGRDRYLGSKGFMTPRAKRLWVKVSAAQEAVGMLGRTNGYDVNNGKPAETMIGKLNHVGVATPSIDESVKLYRDLLGASDIGEKFSMPDQGVWVCFVNLPNAQIELIEPYDDASPIKNFLKSNPAGGQHHVCFEVDDIIAARDEMKAKGARVLGTGEPRIGAHGVPIIFLHPKDMGGVLVELMQTPEHAH